MKTIKYIAMMLAMMLAGFSYVACSDDDDDDDGSENEKGNGTVLNKSLAGTVWYMSYSCRCDRDGNILDRDNEGDICFFHANGEYEEDYGSGTWSQSGNYITIKVDYGSGSGTEKIKLEVIKYEHRKSMTVKMACNCEYSGYDDYDEECAYHLAVLEYEGSEDDYDDSGYYDSGYYDSGYYDSGYYY